MFFSHRLLVLLILILAGTPAFAQESPDAAKNVRVIVSGIVSYTRWPALTGQPRLCIFSSSRFASALGDSSDSALPYHPVLVRSEQDALAARCDGIYFGSESPTAQVQLTNKYPSNALLLIAEQNPECIIGSTFCLIINNNEVRFAVNLDSLAHSGIRVNPDVLMLARNKKYG